jgi:hypothetical protein
MPEKRERTPAQVASFERAKSAREANLRRKWEEQQAQSEPPQQSQVKPGDADMAEEETASTTDTPPATPRPATPRPPTPAPVEHQTAEFVELDTDELFSQLHEYKQDIEELKTHVHGLRQGHETLQSDWQQYGVKRHCEINFV